MSQCEDGWIFMNQSTLTLPQTWSQPSDSIRLHPERRRGSEQHGDMDITSLSHTALSFMSTWSTSSSSTTTYRRPQTVSQASHSDEVLEYIHEEDEWITNKKWTCHCTFTRCEFKREKWRHATDQASWDVCKGTFTLNCFIKIKQIQTIQYSHNVHVSMLSPFVDNVSPCGSLESQNFTNGFVTFSTLMDLNDFVPHLFLNVFGSQPDVSLVRILWSTSLCQAAPI